MKAHLTPLERTGPLRVRIKDAIIELIISRQLQPGQHLAEAELAKQLNVSRNPVREALQTLHVEGWLDLRPGKGAFVHDPTPAEVDEVFALRILLEQESARLAAERAEVDDIENLRRICADGRKALAEGDEAQVVLSNAAFHRYVTGMSGNQTLAAFIASLERRVRWYFTPIAKTRGTSSWDEHDELIDAFARGDGTRASSVMRAHAERSRRAYHESDRQQSL